MFERKKDGGAWAHRMVIDMGGWRHITTEGQQLERRGQQVRSKVTRVCGGGAAPPATPLQLYLFLGWLLCGNHNHNHHQQQQLFPPNNPPPPFCLNNLSPPFKQPPPLCSNNPPPASNNPPPFVQTTLGSLYRGDLQRSKHTLMSVT